MASFLVVTVIDQPALLKTGGSHLKKKKQVQADVKNIEQANQYQTSILDYMDIHPVR